MIMVGSDTGCSSAIYKNTDGPTDFRMELPVHLVLERFRILKISIYIELEPILCTHSYKSRRMVPVDKTKPARMVPLSVYRFS